MPLLIFSCLPIYSALQFTTTTTTATTTTSCRSSTTSCFILASLLVFFSITMDPQQRPRQENGGDLQRKVLVFLTLVTFKAAIRLGIATITHSKPSSVSMTDDYYLILFFVFKTLIWTVYLLTLYAMVVIVFSLHRTESRWLVLPLLPLHIAFDVHFYSLKPAEYWDSSNLQNVPTISLAFASIIVAFYHKVTRDFIWKSLYV